MPYNYFQQKAVYDQMNGTAEKERQEAKTAKEAERKTAERRPADPNQLAKLIIDQATGGPGAPKGDSERKRKKRPPKG